MLKLGKISLDVPFFQASLSGYSDRAMRILALEYGSPLTFAGVMLDKMILHPSVLRNPTVVVRDDEHPIGAQLLGTSGDLLARAAKALVEIGYDLIDLNFACPVPKVVRRQRGGFLLTKPYQILEMYRRVRQAVTCPVLMKLRIGFDEGEAAREDFERLCEQIHAEGIDGLIVHGRTVEQKYRGKANWEAIGQLKQRFPHITLVGSGDIFTAEAVTERLAQGSVDGVVIARGAIGNPWIFREARALLTGQVKPAGPSLSEQGEVIRRHFDMVAESYEGRKAIIHFRKFSVSYCKRHPQRRKAQQDLLTAGTAEDVRRAIREWFGT